MSCRSISPGFRVFRNLAAKDQITNPLIISILPHMTRSATFEPRPWLDRFLEDAERTELGDVAPTEILRIAAGRYAFQLKGKH
jgi:hypothetical protein